MKLLIVTAVLIASASAASAYDSRRSLYGSGSSYGTGSNSSGHYVQPFYNSSSGTYTSGHYRSNPNGTQLDNYGTRGNVNPYTGAIGTRSPRY